MFGSGELASREIASQNEKGDNSISPSDNDLGEVICLFTLGVPLGRLSIPEGAGTDSVVGALWVLVAVQRSTLNGGQGWDGWPYNASSCHVPAVGVECTLGSEVGWFE